MSKSKFSFVNLSDYVNIIDGFLMRLEHQIGEQFHVLECIRKCSSKENFEKFIKLENKKEPKLKFSELRPSDHIGILSGLLSDLKIKSIESFKSCFTVTDDSGGAYFGQTNKDGLPDGIGMFLYNDDCIYIGHYKNGISHGFGNLRWPDGTIYSGLFNDGDHSGVGKMIWSSGAIYLGEWHANRQNGYGILFSKNHVQFIGKWHNGNIV